MNFNNKTRIAVIGVSANKNKYGHKIFADLLKSKYNVYGINPKSEKILDQKIYASIDELIEQTSQKPELLLVVVPPEIGLNVLKKAVELKIINVWLQPGAESKSLIEFAQNNNINLIYNACFMVDHKIW